MFGKIILTLGWLLVLAYPQPPSMPARWVISATSSLRVNGSTNINTFNCDIQRYGQTDTLTALPAASGAIINLRGQMALKVSLFDCHNRIMTNDLRKTLQENQYPQLIIRFITLEKMPQTSGKPQTIKGLVNIELAGVSKQVEITYQPEGGSLQNFCLTGTRDINFSDFGLKAPRKLGGMIRTNDRLSIEFKLQLTAIG